MAQLLVAADVEQSSRLVFRRCRKGMTTVVELKRDTHGHLFTCIEDEVYLQYLNKYMYLPTFRHL